LTDAITYFGGACEHAMIDNTHVVVLSGTGPDMVPVPEMAAFAERFGFGFVAHEVGDANRSARVERPFHFIDHNFLAGRRFADGFDINAQARAWCDKVNSTHKRHLHASPRELFAAERVRLRPLPLFVPEVYVLHHRVVDSEGYVNVRCNRYSVPYEKIGHSMEVRETVARIEVYDGPRLCASHPKRLEPLNLRITDPAHRPPRSAGLFVRSPTTVEEQRLCERIPELTEYVALLKKRGRGSMRDLRSLRRMADEYPRAAMNAALAEAARYAMTDLERLERMVLRRITHDFFVLPTAATTHPDPNEDDHE
jgi:hypothetical protein